MKQKRRRWRIWIWKFLDLLVVIFGFVSDYIFWICWWYFLDLLAIFIGFVGNIFGFSRELFWDFSTTFLYFSTTFMYFSTTFTIHNFFTFLLSSLPMTTSLRRTKSSRPQGPPTQAPKLLPYILIFVCWLITYSIVICLEKIYFGIPAILTSLLWLLYSNAEDNEEGQRSESNLSN